MILYSMLMIIGRTIAPFPRQRDCLTLVSHWAGAIYITLGNNACIHKFYRIAGEPTFWDGFRRC